MDFYLESYCGKAFLRLISRGSTIVAEILRMSNNIPQIFFPHTADHKKFKDLLFDFNYLRNMEAYDEQVTKIPDYERLEEDLFERYSAITERFMRLFESIIRYNDDLNNLIDEIKDNSYVESMEVPHISDFRTCSQWKTGNKFWLRVTTIWELCSFCSKTCSRVR